MTTECKTNFEKVNELIKQKQIDLKTDAEPEIHSISSGILFQYFHDWIKDVKIGELGESSFEYLSKPINSLNSKETIKEVKFCYANLQKIEKLKLETSKMIIILDGCAEIYNHTTNEKVLLDPFSMITLKKDDVISIETLCDINYYIIIDHNSPLT